MARSSPISIGKEFRGAHRQEGRKELSWSRFGGEIGIGVRATEGRHSYAERFQVDAMASSRDIRPSW